MNGTEKPDARGPRWTLATPEDVAAVDFEALLAEATTADSYAISRVYDAAAVAEDGPERRVFHMLSAVLSMGLHGRNGRDAYTAMLTFADGRRSALPIDFRGTPLSAVADAGEKARYAPVRARLCDLAWSVERRRNSSGTAAVAAYTQTVELVADGALQFDHQPARHLGFQGIELVRRALVIAHSKSFGDAKPNTDRLVELVHQFRLRALGEKHTSEHDKVCQIELDFGLSPPESIALELESSAATLNDPADGHQLIDVLKTARSAWHMAKQPEEASRVQLRISDAYVGLADANEGSAMMTSGFLSQAIRALAGAAGVRDRKKALRHRLVEAQASISEEMSTFTSDEIDLSDLREATLAAFKDDDVYDTLFVFSCLHQPAEPSAARQEAIEALKRSPLMGLIPKSYHDDEGKVRYKSGGFGSGQDDDEAEIAMEMAKSLSMSRQIAVAGRLDPARRLISQRFYIASDVLLPLVAQSPFVAPGYERTFARGFELFFLGDIRGALYVLVPMVEAGVRYWVRENGHDVTSFDEATGLQADMTLSALFRELRSEIADIFTEPFAFEIDQVFLAPAGPQLRHAVAHGLLDDAQAHSTDAFYACWLIFQLCVFPLIDHRSKMGLPSFS